MGIRISELLRYAEDTSLSKDVLAQITQVYMLDGGPGSGNHGHKGIKGHWGGSAKRGQGGGSGDGSYSDRADSGSSYGSPDRRKGKVLTSTQIETKFHKTLPKMQPTFGYSLWHSKGYSEAPVHAKMLVSHRTSAGIPRATAEDASKARKYTNRHGVGTKALPFGTGVTRIDQGSLGPGRRFANTLTEYSMLVDGKPVLTPQREELHHAIVDHIFSGAIKPKQGQKKVFTMLGGGSAAGKSTVTHSGDIIPDAQHSPVIDADELKANLPEYADEPDRDAAAAECHLESSVLSGRALQAGWVNGYNLTLDGTGDGDIDRLLGKIKRARHYGYEVNSVYVTCPTEVALQRAKNRGQETGRVVPESIVRSTHINVSKIWPVVAPEFDHTVLYDSDQPDKKPKLIAECFRGQEIRVYDKQAYNRFLAKGLQHY